MQKRCGNRGFMKIANSKHYAKSLVAVGKECGCFNELYDDLKDVSGKLDANLDFKKVLLNKQVSFARKQEIVKQIFQDFIGERTYNFIFLLLKHEKLALLNEILILARRMNLSETDAVEVVVETAVPLSVDQEKAIAQILKQGIGVNAILRNVINEKLIGGLKLKIHDTIIDSSVFGKIFRLKEKIEKFE